MSQMSKNQSSKKTGARAAAGKPAGTETRSDGTVSKPAAERNKQKSQIIIAALIAVAFAAAILVLRSAAGSGGGESGGAPTVVTDADLVISVGDISPVARFYPVEIDGTRLEVIAVEAPDGTVRTAFNTCQICYDSGRGYYKQIGDLLECQNCGNRFRMDQVEVLSGGCNPVPIFPDDKTVTDETVTISYDFLKESKDIFAHWKT
jgi:uncharacterized membrane protein